MKVEIEEEKKGFQPIDVKIKIESEEELFNLFWRLFLHSEDVKKYSENILSDADDVDEFPPFNEEKELLLFYSVIDNLLESYRPFTHETSSKTDEFGNCVKRIKQILSDHNCYIESDLERTGDGYRVYTIVQHKNGKLSEIIETNKISC